MASDAWFEVDRDGLRKLLEKRGKAFAVFELIQNAWDTDAKHVTVNLSPVEGKPLAVLEVADDDPRGFIDLSHAFTLFAESTKKGDPTKRGLYCLGDKLVLALCETAEIVTTSGGVSFGPEGRKRTRERTQQGSVVRCRIRMNREELSEVEAAISRLIPPRGVVTTFNGKPLVERTPLTASMEKLPTMVADEEGVMRRRERVTAIDYYEPAAGEVGTLYEMGIPVVETGDRFHANVAQKVLLNTDRDNVTPKYLEAVRTVMLNATARFLSGEEATAPWVRVGTSDERCSRDAIEHVHKLRFGEKTVAQDVRDREAEKIAASQGYIVVPGGALTSGEWKNLKKHELILPAGKVTPSDSELFVGYTDVALDDHLQRCKLFVEELGRELLGVALDVVFLSSPESSTLADFNMKAQRIRFNVGRLGHEFFRNVQSEALLDLILHEFAHMRSGDHRSADFHDACCALGALMTRLALRKPQIFSPLAVP